MFGLGYYKLHGEEFGEEIVDELDVTFGRIKDEPSRNFVGLGSSTKLSREHLRIFWKQRWYAEVLGKNGATIDCIYRGRHEIVELRHLTPVLLGDCKFFFMLPQHP